MINKEKISWQIFDNWDYNKILKQLNWNTFSELTPFYKKMNEYQLKEYHGILTIWNNKLIDFGNDPTNYDWSDFRPLRIKREEDWSSWLAFLIQHSETGIFAREILKNKEFEYLDYISPIIKLENEDYLRNYRADMIIKWKNKHYSHIEVKVRDRNLKKTFKTSEQLQKTHKIANNKWANFIILLPSQLIAWDSEIDDDKTGVIIKSITWDKISIALRKSLIADENIKWKTWAYSIIGAIEQKLLGFKGFENSHSTSAAIDLKTEILKKSLQYE